MRKHKEVEIEDVKYKVYELRIRDIWELGQQLTSLPRSKRLEVKIDLEEGKEYTAEQIKEKVSVDIKLFENKKYTVGVVRELIEEKLKAEQGKAFMDLIKKWLPEMTSIKWENLYGFAPSEIEELWEAFLEVNKSFLSILKKMGLQKIWDSILKTFQTDLMVSYQGLLQPDIKTS